MQDSRCLKTTESLLDFSQWWHQAFSLFLTKITQHSIYTVDRGFKRYVFYLECGHFSRFVYQFNLDSVYLDKIQPRISPREFRFRYFEPRNKLTTQRKLVFCCFLSVHCACNTMLSACRSVHCTCRTMHCAMVHVAPCTVRHTEGQCGMKCIQRNALYSFSSLRFAELT